MRTYASCRKLAGASCYAGFLAPIDPRNCLGRSCALLRPILLGGPQIHPHRNRGLVGYIGGQAVETR
jgi:hypothetical protein